MKKNVNVTQVENTFSADVRLISITDVSGRITFANQAFVDISGYSLDELVGRPHNMVRHPDMPKEAFADLWAQLKAGKPWMGLVKNRCKNGDHYWVNAYVTPVYQGETLMGYQSVRTKPEADYVANAERVYARLRQGKKLNAGLQLNNNTQQFLFTLIIIVSPLLLVSIFQGFSWLSLGVGGISCIVAAVLVGYLQSRPWKRLQHLAQNTHDSSLACFAYLGDVTVQHQAEIALKALQSQQVTLLELLQNSASHLMTVIQSNNSIVEQNNQSVSQQSDEISQLATAINEMSATIQDVAQNAQEAVTNTHDASSEADQGKNIISHASDSIAELVKEVSQASQLIHQIDEDTKNISNIITVIEDIAEQTNLLALNAAIEAARAGESGRGFAVVADEVRTLANRTRISTSEIEAMINKLQLGVEKAVNMMDISQTHAEKTVSEAAQVSATLNNISERVSIVNDMNIQIATATEEQSAVTEEINRNVTNIHDAARDLNQAADESAEAGKELEEVAVDMNSVVTHFR